MDWSKGIVRKFIKISFVNKNWGFYICYDIDIIYYLMKYYKIYCK